MSKKRLVWILAVALATVTVAFAANAGRLLVVDAPQTSDVILVLGSESDRRPARALELLDQGYGRKVVIDVSATDRIYNFSPVQLAEEYGRSLPQKASVRICPIKGLSTREEAHDAEKCLANEDGSRILIVTSDYHSRRALSIFRHEIPRKPVQWLWLATTHNSAPGGGAIVSGPKLSWTNGCDWRGGMVSTDGVETINPTRSAPNAWARFTFARISGLSRASRVSGSKRDR